MEPEMTNRIGGAMRTTDLAFVDIETTGLDYRVNEIIEIAVVRVRQAWSKDQKPVFEKILEWSAKIKPQHLDISRVNGQKIFRWKMHSKNSQKKQMGQLWSLIMLRLTQVFSKSSLLDTKSKIKCIIIVLILFQLHLPNLQNTQKSADIHLESFVNILEL